MSGVGKLMFAKKLKANARTGVDVTYKGHAMVLVIGHLANGAPLPTRNQFMALVHNAGACMFDDVAEFLGDDMLNKLMEGLSKKYAAPDSVKIEEGKVPPPFGVVPKTETEPESVP